VEEVKKILGLTLAVVLVIGLVAGGTWAYFSDTETSTGNVFSAGTIDLEVNTENPWTSAAVTTELSDLKPCEVGWVTITIKNVGTNPMDVWKRITTVSCAENGTVEPEQDWYAANPGELTNNQKNDIDTVILYDLKINDVYEIEESEILHIDDIVDNYIYLGTLAPGASMTVEQSYHMEGDTENWAQSDTMTFTIEFFAQQTVGSAPSPIPELSGHAKT